MSDPTPEMIQAGEMRYLELMDPGAHNFASTPWGRHMVAELYMAMVRASQGPHEDSGHCYTDTERQLMQFYGVRTPSEVIEEQAKHIRRLQDKVQDRAADPFPPSYRQG